MNNNSGEAELTLVFKDGHLLLHMDVKSRHLEGAHGHIFFRNKVSSNSRWHRRSDETFTVLWRLWQGLPVARCQTKQKLKVVGDGRGHFLRKDSCQWSEKSTLYDMMIVTPLSTQGRGWVQGKPQWRCKSGWPSCRCPRKLKSTPLKMVELQTNQCQNRDYLRKIWKFGKICTTSWAGLSWIY